MASQVDNQPQIFSSALEYVSSSPPAKRTRSEVSEAEEEESDRPAKQFRKLSTSPTPASVENQLLPRSSSQALSQENLRQLDNDNESMAEYSGIKRSSSQRSITGRSDSTLETKSSIATGSASYRYQHLRGAGVTVHGTLPDDISAAVDDIFGAEVSEGRRRQLEVISTRFQSDFSKAVGASSGEDDSMLITTDLVKAIIGPGLIFHANADMRDELKPPPRPSYFNFDALDGQSIVADGQQSHVDKDSSLPRKRQQRSATGTDLPTAESPLEATTMRPPAVPSSVKTPRPDLTVGIDTTSIASRLSSGEFTYDMAEQFLIELQINRKSRDDKPSEPFLILSPAPRASNLACPFLVVEGKGYCTGRQVFEAENQAAGSGACALLIQVRLDEKVRLATSIGSPQPPIPLFFSIVNEGPIHLLYAHCTYVKDGARHYTQKIQGSCHALLPSTVDHFLIKLHQVCSWGAGPFADSVVERLGMLARAAHSKTTL